MGGLVLEKVKLKFKLSGELCRPSRGRMGPCFVVFAEEFGGGGAE